jgi:signal transduction histidine kinase
VIRFALFPVAVTVLILGATVWRARPDSPVNRWFATFSVSVAAWTFCVAILYTSDHRELWGRLAFGAAAVIPASFLAFIRSYPAPGTWPPRHIVTSFVILASLLSAASIATPFVVYDVVLTTDGITRRTGVLYPAFAVFFLIASILSIGGLLQKWRSSRGVERAQLEYLAAGLLLSMLGGVALNLVLPLITGHSRYSWGGPYFALLLLAIIGHALVRHRLLDLRPVILRGFVYTAAAFSLGAALLVSTHFLITRSTSFSVAIPSALVLPSIIALVLISVPVQRTLTWLVEPYLFRRGTNYAERLAQATRRLSRLMSPEEFAVDLMAVLGSAFIPEPLAILVRRPDSHALEAIGPQTRPQESDGLAMALSRIAAELPSPAVIPLASNESPIDSGTASILRLHAFEVAVTLGRRNSLLGVALLGPRRSGDPYYTSDLTYLASLADVASIALENALLYRQRIHILEYSNRLLESLDSAVVATDTDGRITSANRAASRLLDVEQWDPAPTLAVLPSPIAWAMAFALRCSWAVREVEATIDTQTHKALPVVFSTTVLHDEAEGVSGALVVVTDLSVVKAFERSHRRTEHLATMNRFYAGIAHEIRTPLTSISNFVAMLSERFDDVEYREAASRILPLEVARIVRLAERLRLMAPSQDATLASTDLSQLLADVLTLQEPRARERGVTLSLDCSADALRVMADADQLMQLFVNLVNNAIEAIPNGGTVVVRAHRDSTSDTILAQVIDDGVGLEPQLRSKIFQPFFTTKSLGTGLGLAICKEIADFHHVQLTVESRTDARGTIAMVEFDDSLEKDETTVVSSTENEFLSPRRGK